MHSNASGRKDRVRAPKNVIEFSGYRMPLLGFSPILETRTSISVHAMSSVANRCIKDARSNVAVVVMRNLCWKRA
jgi:hypothetical protein